MAAAWTLSPPKGRAPRDLRLAGANRFSDASVVQRCEQVCPARAITLTPNPPSCTSYSRPFFHHRVYPQEGHCGILFFDLRLLSSSPARRLPPGAARSRGQAGDLAGRACRGHGLRRSGGHRALRYAHQGAFANHCGLPLCLEQAHPPKTRGVSANKGSQNHRWAGAESGGGGGGHPPHISYRLSVPSCSTSFVCV